MTPQETPVDAILSAEQDITLNGALALLNFIASDLQAMGYGTPKQQDL